MLSEKEYQRIQNQLKTIPTTSATKQQNDLRKRLNKQLKEHEYASNYPPFTPFPYISYFISRTTTETCLHQVIQAATLSNEFTIDSESISVYKQKNQPALLQLQIFLPCLSSFILLIEAHHLPDQNSTTFKLIRQMFEIIFSPDKRIYLWGSKKELFPFTNFKLFTNEQLNHLHTINLQQQFKIFWNEQHPRHRNSSTLTTSNILDQNCMCEICLNIESSELWSLQNAVKCELKQYLSKQFTIGKFHIGLDSNLYELESDNKHYRQQLTDYALNDCLSMQRLIIQMTHKNFMFTIDQIKHVQPIQTYLTSISSTDDDDDDIFSSPRFTSSILKQNSSNESKSQITATTTTSNPKLTINNIFNLDKLEPISSDDDEQLRPTTTRQTTIVSVDPTIQTNDDHQQHNSLLKEQRRRIHNRSCTLKQRKRYYRHEIIIKNIDHRFTIKNIKSILRNQLINFNIINTSTTTRTNQRILYIGIKTPDLILEYKRRIQHLFTRDHYEQFKRLNKSSYKDNRCTHNKQESKQ